MLNQFVCQPDGIARQLYWSRPVAFAVSKIQLLPDVQSDRLAKGGKATLSFNGEEAGRVVLRHDDKRPVDFSGDAIYDETGAFSVYALQYQRACFRRQVAVRRVGAAFDREGAPLWIGAGGGCPVSDPQIAY